MRNPAVAGRYPPIPMRTFPFPKTCDLEQLLPAPPWPIQRTTIDDLEAHAGVAARLRVGREEACQPDRFTQADSAPIGIGAPDQRGEAADIFRPYSLRCFAGRLSRAMKWRKISRPLRADRARRCQSRRAVRWVKRSGWAGFLATDPKTRSKHQRLPQVIDPWFVIAKEGRQKHASKDSQSFWKGKMVDWIFGGYRAAPPGLRIWCGACETSVSKRSRPGLDWALPQVERNPPPGR